MEQHGLTKELLPFGVALPGCDLVDVRSTDGWAPDTDSDEYRLGDYSPGRWAFILANVQALVEPVPVNGRQQMWRLPAGSTPPWPSS